MEETWTNRTELLIGKVGIEKLRQAKVIVYGIGGVGSFVVEGLVRSRIGHLVLVDNDIISISNLNRQIHANHKTIGKRKIDVMKERILDINPEVVVETYMVQEIEKEEELIDTTFSYVIDAVDTVKTKIKVIERATEMQIPVISCMGTGNKLDPTRLEIADIQKTSVCPLARVMEIVSMKILIDADACPVVSIVEHMAEKYGIPVILLCDTNHVLQSEYSEVKVIGAGADAVDFALVGLCQKGDLVVTQDYGVAAMILGKGAYGIHQSGKWYTDENIDRMLMERHISKKIRRSKSKYHLKGPAKRTAEDDVRFEESLERLILKIL